jgi:hypothetical protein
MTCFYMFLQSRDSEEAQFQFLTQSVSPSLAPFGDEESDMVEIGMKGQFLKED